MILSGRALAQRFDEHFEIRLATTEEHRQEVYKVRGDVYCHEFGYEPEENCPNGLEQDDYDEQSVHCVIRHRKLDEPAGCVRLIMQSARDPHTQLPFEPFCGGLERGIRRQPPHRITEVSRLAVKSCFRKPPLDALSASEKQIFPLVTTSLFMAAPVIAAMSGRTDNFAMMEPRLVRLLKRSSGFDFRQVGDLVDYHGIRAAFHITTERMIANLHPRLRELFELVGDALAADFQNNAWDFLAAQPTFVGAPAFRPTYGLPPAGDIAYSPA